MSAIKKLTKGGKSINHNLIGREVWFHGTIWKVISAHTTNTKGSPWLTLKRALGIETLAKVHEVREAFN